MILRAEVSGVFTTNTYFYIDDSTRRGFLIDPGAQAGRLLSIIKDNDLTIEKILLTHGHFDHFGAADALRKKLSVPVCMHENGRTYVENPRWNLSAECGVSMTLTDVEYIPDGNSIVLSNNPSFSLKLVYIPGHTTDGAMYYSAGDGVAFVGDSIFKNSFGLTHFYGGDRGTLMQSVLRRILTLPDDTVLLSGHSDPTTVGEEKSRPWFLPFVR